MSERFTATFDRLRAEGRAGFVPYIMGGDPDLATTAELLDQLPGAGADVIELGFAFTDPTADGPSIEAAGRRALLSGTSVLGVLGLARAFRARHADTPLVLMGYANPLHAMGYDVFAAAARDSGVDGVIVVDLPPEEDAGLRTALAARDVALIRLATPTTHRDRLPQVLENAAGFVYYVSATGVTGAVSAAAEVVQAGLAPLRAATNLPLAVGFGVRSEEQAAAIAAFSDLVVVGSAIVEALNRDGVDGALSTVRALSRAVHGARTGAIG